uniref:G_PROTEIN_RECEP_F1_2 domain-containing protein n=1 Tax=Caenorhabditis tropicalis TaxID=1561998 RepID=A0A1I7TUX1_9PELO
MSNLSSFEKLYIPSCASEEVHNVFTSPLMIFNHFFLFILIGISFFMSSVAWNKLTHHNVFPECTRILLFTAMINGVIHQSTTVIIRMEALVHSIRYRNEPCSILFQSSECFYYVILYYHTNLFTSFCCFSLFIDRLLSANPRSFYHSYQKTASIIYIIIQIILPFVILYWVFSDSIYTGYVPMCNYPPANASSKFYVVSYIRLGFLFFVFIAASFLYKINRKREKLMIHNVYHTETRYQSYENFLATKAICIIILSQIICLVSTSTTPSIFNMFRDTIPQTWFHLVNGFMTGVTYSNFLVPIIIWYQTKKIMKDRHEMIMKLRKQKETFDDHFASLDIYWKKKKEEISDIE